MIKEPCSNHIYLKKLPQTWWFFLNILHSTCHYAKWPFLFIYLLFIFHSSSVVHKLHRRQGLICLLINKDLRVCLSTSENLTRIVRILLAFSKPLSVCIEKQWIISSTRISFTHNCSLGLYLSLFLSVTYKYVIPIHKNGHKSFFSSTETEEISNLLAKDVYSSSNLSWFSILLMIALLKL